ncbi:Uncharacterised protein [Pluralibacter gergoviae]|nr:Uncharacterised protein [Pluralibacter gergoviae]
MPRIKKEKAAAGERVRQRPGQQITSCGTDNRRGFVQHAVDEFVAVFSAEGFRQFDTFVDGNFVRHVVTL